MKKFLLSLMVSLASLAAMAQSYSEEILVAVNGNAGPVTTGVIEVTKNTDGTCDFLLRNFVLKAEPDPDFPDVDMSNPVGNIRLKGVKMEDKGSYTAISTSQTIKIEAGDDPSVEHWMGPDLPEVPIVLNGKMTDKDLFAAIQIDLVVMKVDVTVGTDFTQSSDVKKYTEEIAVSVNGNAAPVTTGVIEVKDNGNSSCDFLLRNFVLKAEPDPDFPDVDMSNPVGNIRLKSVKMEDKGSYTAISTSQTIKIEAGDDPTVEHWMGPDLPEVPIVLNGKMTDTNLFATIQIDLVVMKIDVTIGKDLTTGIEHVTVNKVNAPVYNLNGIRVADQFSKALPQGIYIVGGKKMIVK